MPSSKHKISEESRLIENPPSPNTTGSDSFIIANSVGHEIKLLSLRSSLMTLQMLCQLGSPVVALIFVGQLPNSTIYLAGVGLSRTFVNVTGTAMAWGFTTSLFTLLPQSIGAKQTKLTSIHIQRAFHVVTIVSCILSVAQFFAGDIMIAIGQPSELAPIINSYCRLLVPYIFLTAYDAILMRAAQSLDLNIGLTYCCLIMIACAPLFTWLFMYGLGFGYKGAAIAQCCVLAVFAVAQIILFFNKGYGYLFIPHSLNVIYTKTGMMDYINLAIPGLFQSAFQWIIEEVAVILAGYVAQPDIALSTTVILLNVLLIVIPFSIGICNATNLRVGKYVGSGNILYAKLSAKIGMIIAIIVLIIWCLIFIFGKDVIPSIYTDNMDTIALTSKMMFIVVIYAMGCFIMMTIGGIYRGLGFQKIAAYFVFISYWIIAWPISMILLFRFDVRYNLTYGVGTIWCGLALGNILASIGGTMYMLCCVNWNDAITQSENRIEHTKMEYQSINVSEIKSKIIN
eukprot:541202_1